MSEEDKENTNVERMELFFPSRNECLRCRPFFCLSARGVTFFSQADSLKAKQEQDLFIDLRRLIC